MITIQTTVRDRRIDVPAPSDLPDGTPITLTIAECDELRPPSSDAIATILAAMQTLGTWEIPDDVASGLDEWERQINQRGIEHRDSSVEEAFP